MILSLQEIEQHFSHELVEAGRRLIERGDLSATDIQRGGEVVTTVVRQAEGRPLRVYIRIAREAGGPAIHGECGCDDEGQCVHVIAALIHALGEQRKLADPIPADGDAPPGYAPATTTSERPQLLLYLLHLNHNRLSVESCVARRLTQGGYEAVCRFEPVQAKHSTPARFLEALDLELLQALDRLPLDPATHLPELGGADSARLFEKLLSTRRCHFGSIEGGGTLRRGEPRKIELFWSVDPFGRQRLAWRTSPPTRPLLSLSQPWYLDSENALCAPLQCDLPSESLRELMNLQPLAPDRVEEWFASFRERHPGLRLPPPQTFEHQTASPARPLPCLCLTGKKHRLARQGYDGSGLACLSFVYRDIEIAPSAPATYLSDGRLIQIERDERVETASMAQLLDLGLELHHADEMEGTYLVPITDFPQTTEQAWIDFQTEAIPQLREQGWRIEFDAFPLRLAKTDRWHCHIDRLERKDWFTLSLDLELEGRRIELLPLLLKLLESLPAERGEMEQRIGRHLLLPMEDIDGNACLLRLSGDRAMQILELLLEVCGNRRPKADHAVKINRAQLARLASLDSDCAVDPAPIHWNDEESRQLAQRLRTLDAIPPCAPPVSLQAELRLYQQQGLEWLQFLREYHLAGILADDMGLGKTLQTLAHLLLEKEAGRTDRPSLAVIPTSLTFNWLQEAQRFAPGLKVLLLQGAQRKARFRQLPDYDLVITTYPLLSRDWEALKIQPYHLLILDEAQTIKNHKSQASRVVRDLEARHRLCLTGTPMENHLGELWSLFDFLMPGLLGDHKQFRRDFRIPIEQRRDEAAATRLSQRLRPYLLRRTKQQVAKELPDKTEIIQGVTLEGGQRELYETVRLSMHRRVREEIERQGLARSQILVLGALMKLRQVCCDPRLLKDENAEAAPASAKLAHLMTLLEEMVEEGRRILLFSQFTTMLDLIEAEVAQAGIGYVKLTGQTRDRETPVKHFQQGKAPLFLISLKAGGVGLNLTAADTVIHYDPWWNPAVERQATDRSHRIGQTQKVFVYKLICEGTLEEKILAMQQRKQRLAEGLYREDAGGEPQWSEEDIEALFGPLHPNSRSDDEACDAN